MEMQWWIILIVIAVIFLIAISVFLFSILSPDGAIAQAINSFLGLGKNYGNI